MKTPRPHDPGTWPVTKTLRPGQHGTGVEVERYGSDLLVVRYRKLDQKTVKTVELIEWKIRDLIEEMLEIPSKEWIE